MKPKDRIPRKGCKLKTLEYWVRREESLDDAGNKIVDFYASADNIYKLDQKTKVKPEKPKYEKEIAWVRCSPGFINEVRYRERVPKGFKTWYNGCGVTTELVKVCIQDPKLNKATKEVMKEQLKWDSKWITNDKKQITTTMTNDEYEKWKKLMFNRYNDDPLNPSQLNKDFCSNLIGFVPFNRLLDKSEDGGLKNVLKAGKEAGTVDKLFFKYFDADTTEFKRAGLIEDALKQYKNGKIGKDLIVADTNDEAEDVTGKVFFCKAGKDFYKDF